MPRIPLLFDTTRSRTIITNNNATHEVFPRLVAVERVVAEAEDFGVASEKIMRHRAIALTPAKKEASAAARASEAAASASEEAALFYRPRQGSHFPRQGSSAGCPGGHRCEEPSASRDWRRADPEARVDELPTGVCRLQVGRVQPVPPPLGGDSGGLQRPQTPRRVARRRPSRQHGLVSNGRGLLGSAAAPGNRRFF